MHPLLEPVLRAACTTPRSEPITALEMLDLHQIATHIDTLGAQRMCDPALSALIVPAVREPAKTTYQTADICVDLNLQQNLIQRLTHNNVSASPNLVVSPACRLDVGLPEAKIGIVLTNSIHLNEDKKPCGREHFRRIFAQNSGYRIVDINTESWAGYSEEEKAQTLANISKA